jgi:hypothetical protein
VQNVGGVDILETAEDLVNEGLEVGVGKRLAGTNNSSQITLHQLYVASAYSFSFLGNRY